jgi:hypothetical protein
MLPSGGTEEQAAVGVLVVVVDLAVTEVPAAPVSAAAAELVSAQPAVSAAQAQALLVRS